MLTLTKRQSLWVAAHVNNLVAMLITIKELLEQRERVINTELDESVTQNV